MYPQENYGSGPSTPVNSPPPLTSQSTNLHNAGPSASSSSTWQSINAPGQPPVILNGQYSQEMIHRGIHMVSISAFFSRWFI
jgi:hypothetical protein